MSKLADKIIALKLGLTKDTFILICNYINELDHLMLYYAYGLNGHNLSSDDFEAPKFNLHGNDRLIKQLMYLFSESRKFDSFLLDDKWGSTFCKFMPADFTDTWLDIICGFDDPKLRKKPQLKAEVASKISLRPTIARLNWLTDNNAKENLILVIRDALSRREESLMNLAMSKFLVDPKWTARINNLNTFMKFSSGEVDETPEGKIRSSLFSLGDLIWACQFGWPLDKVIYGYALKNEDYVMLEWLDDHGCPQK
tara:strand:- start:46697 stop:47458 length:762 start_codon:yes stop_codon:yes gene_type:complete